MEYNVISTKAPTLPNLGKGTECINLLLSQASKDMHAPLVPMLFPLQITLPYRAIRQGYCPIRQGYLRVNGTNENSGGDGEGGGVPDVNDGFDMG